MFTGASHLFRLRGMYSKGSRFYRKVWIILEVFTPSEEVMFMELPEQDPTRGLFWSSLKPKII